MAMFRARIILYFGKTACQPDSRVNSTFHPWKTASSFIFSIVEKTKNDAVIIDLAVLRKGPRPLLQDAVDGRWQPFCGHISCALSRIPVQSDLRATVIHLHQARSLGRSQVVDQRSATCHGEPHRGLRV